MMTSTEVRCPRCGKDFVRRVRGSGLVETVASMLYFYPFACRLCAHRFRAWQWGVRYPAESLDQRRYERIFVNFPMSFSTDSGGWNGTTLDISLGGCSFKTEPPPPPGTLAQVQLHAPGLGRPLVVEAAIVRSVRFIYVGMEFLRLRPEEQYRLTQFVADMLTDRRLKDPASQAGRLRETDAVPQMR